MGRMFLAERTVFAQFNAIRRGTFVLGSNIIPSFTVATGHGNLYTHILHPLKTAMLKPIREFVPEVAKLPPEISPGFHFYKFITLYSMLSNFLS